MQCGLCMYARQDAHTHAHTHIQSATLHALRILLTLCPGSIRSERPSVPPQAAMQMKRNALIKGEILKMRGQKEDRVSECLKKGRGGPGGAAEGWAPLPLGEMRGGGGVSVDSSGRS